MLVRNISPNAPLPSLPLPVDPAAVTSVSAAVFASAGAAATTGPQGGLAVQVEALTLAPQGEIQEALDASQV